jgi:hypothetical protein
MQLLSVNVLSWNLPVRDVGIVEAGDVRSARIEKHRIQSKFQKRLSASAYNIYVRA